jgi:hypothetical protein
LWGGFSRPNYPAEEVPYAQAVQIVRTFTRNLFTEAIGKRLATYCNLTSQRKSVLVSVNQHNSAQLSGENATFAFLTQLSGENATFAT